MLSHYTVTISEALTRIPANKEGRAVQNFRDILIWMGDRYAQDFQRQASKDAIVKLACTDDDLRDEVFAQLLKQLTDNPSERSSERGWQLMEHLCTCVGPSKQMTDCVQKKIKALADEGDDTTKDYVK